MQANVALFLKKDVTFQMDYFLCGLTSIWGHPGHPVGVVQVWHLVHVPG